MWHWLFTPRETVKELAADIQSLFEPGLSQHVSYKQYVCCCLSQNVLIPWIYEFYCRPFVVQKISFSNMILVVVDTLCTFPEEKKLSITPDEVRYNSSLACFKVHSDLPQKRPTSCIKQHPKVSACRLSASLCLCIFYSFLYCHSRKVFIIKILLLFSLFLNNHEDSQSLKSVSLRTTHISEGVFLI